MTAEAEPRRCGSCDAPIRFGRTRSGRRIPIDLEPVADGNLVESAPDVFLVEKAQGLFDADRPRYVSHFVTCPDRDSWRRKR